MLGSRVMHYVVSHKLIDKLNIQEKEEFFMGGLAPDASQNKADSHFFEGDHADYTKKIAYEKFHDKDQKNGHKAYIRGYYAHLITDHIWLTGFYLPWLKNRIENDPSLQKQHHNDFSLLNRLLVDYYKIPMLKRYEIHDTEIPDLDEVLADDVKKLFSALEDDLRTDVNESSQLKVFTFKQIIGYIETSVEVSTKMLSKK